MDNLFSLSNMDRKIQKIGFGQGQREKKPGMQYTVNGSRAQNAIELNDSFSNMNYSRYRIWQKIC